MSALEGIQNRYVSTLPAGRAVADGEKGHRSGKSFVNADLANAVFEDVSLAGAAFTDINLSSARFDDINFADAEITGNCNFRGMTIAGIPVEDLFAAYRRAKPPRS
jgi:uncharacterized protein YjbI with pentapeptide repeats